MSASEQNRSVFKKCPMCGFVWKNRVGFLSDACVEIIGYQACLEELAAGYFLFNHSCEGTLAIRVDEFEGLYDGPVFEGRRTGTDACPGFCLHRDELRPCPAECACAYAREIVQLVKNWPKDRGVLA
jgi:hypothetical protein